MSLDCSASLKPRALRKSAALRLASENTAPARSAFVKSASWRSQPDRLAERRIASRNCACWSVRPRRSAPLRLAPAKSRPQYSLRAPARRVPERSAAGKALPVISACERSTPARSAPAKLLSWIFVPFKRALRSRTPRMFAVTKTASVRSAPVKSAPSRTALPNSAPHQSARRNPPCANSVLFRRHTARGSRRRRGPGRENHCRTSRPNPPVAAAVCTRPYKPGWPRWSACRPAQEAEDNQKAVYKSRAPVMNVTASCFGVTSRWERSR